MKSYIILTFIHLTFIVEGVYADCSIADVTTSSWSSGRNGKLLIPAKNGDRVVIFITTPVSGFNPHCLKRVSKTGTKYVFKIRSWCPFEDGKRKIEYNMNYKQENKAKIQKIKILNKVYCSDTVSPSSSPQPSVPPVVTSSCVSYITALNERVGYENGNIKLPIPNTVSDWSLTIGFDGSYNGFNIIEGQITESKICLKTYSAYDHNKQLTAGDKLILTYHLNYDQSKVKPNIVYVQLKSGKNNQLTCGIKLSCIITTTTTTTTTSTKASTTASGLTGSISCDSYISSNPWQGGDAGSIQFKVPETSNGWTLEIGFNYPPTDFFMSGAKRINGGSRCMYDFTNWVYNKIVNAGSIVKFDFNFHYQWDLTNVPKIEFVLFSSTSVICGAPSSCSATRPTTTTTTTLPSSSSTSRSPSLSTSTSTSTSASASSSTSTSRSPSTSTSTTTSTSRSSSSSTSTSTSSSPSTSTSTSTLRSSSSSTSTSRSPTPSTSTTSSTSRSTSTSTVTSTPSTCEPDYNYTEVIKKSLMFYEAQRSGQLTIKNRIPWRLTSTLNDGSLVGVDLSGGYFDAGDFVKFTFPAASAITVLAWGMLEFEEGYKFANQYQQGLDAIKWATDFFIKCHTEKYKFWAQVGEGHIDHASWGRANELDDSTRKCHALSPDKPGSDLLGEVSAALAASSLVFKKVDSLYSDKLLNHAKDLYNFAKTYKGKYSDSISDAKDFYKSWSGYYDELAWAASWLYYATNDLVYLTDAEATWNSGQMSQVSEEFSWDNKGRGVAVLLSHLTGKSAYTQNAKDFCHWLQYKAPSTPKGMVFLQEWGSNRHAANVAFICLALTKYNPTIEFVSFSRKQIHLLLGDAGRSYVVGFGNNPPQRPHHSGASCPDRPAPCSWNYLHTTNPNPQILFGALVGGPNSQGIYEDRRNNYVTNEVALDYNAGFQSALAALLVQQKEGKC